METAGISYFLIMMDTYAGLSVSNFDEVAPAIVGSMDRCYLSVGLSGNGWSALALTKLTGTGFPLLFSAVLQYSSNYLSLRLRKLSIMDIRPTDLFALWVVCVLVIVAPVEGSFESRSYTTQSKTLV